MRNSINLVLGSVCLLALTGCFDSSGELPQPPVPPPPVVVEPPPPSGPNLTISRLEANNLNSYQSGDDLLVDYQFEVEEFDSVDFAIDFYLVHASSEADNNVETEIQETHLLGSVEHLAISTGSYVETARFELPTVADFGQFWVVSVVDPDNDVEEINEDDNFPNIDNDDHAAGGFPAVEIEILASLEHDLAFVSGYIDDGLVMLDSPEVHVGTGENHSDVIGHLDAIYFGSRPATAALTAEVEINGVYQAVQLWDASNSSYVNSQEINFNYNGDEHFFGFDIALDNDQLADLYAQYDSSAISNEIHFRLTLSDTTEHGPEVDPDNNQIELSAPLFFFEQTEPEDAGERPSKVAKSIVPTDNNLAMRALDVESTGNRLSVDGSFNAGYGDASKFRVAVDLEGEMTADLLEKAAALEAGGAVNMWIFNAQNTIFSITYDGQAYLSGINTGYSSEMVIFNTTVFEDEYYNAQFAISLEKSWEEERVLASARFFVGPIPIKVSAGITGGVGFELNLGYALSELTADGDVFSTNFGGFASGSVDVLIAEAGVTAELNVIDNVLALDSSASLALLDEGELDPRVEYEFELTDEIDVISGRFGLFAIVRGIKWCKFLGVPYPCGTKTTDYYLWFYQTPSVFAKSWVIFEEEGAIRLP